MRRAVIRVCSCTEGFTLGRLDAARQNIRAAALARFDNRQLHKVRNNRRGRQISATRREVVIRHEG